MKAGAGRKHERFYDVTASNLPINVLSTFYLGGQGHRAWDEEAPGTTCRIDEYRCAIERSKQRLPSKLSERCAREECS
jgi:hypothetical protein